LNDDYHERRRRRHEEGLDLLVDIALVLLLAWLIAHLTGWL